MTELKDKAIKGVLWSFVESFSNQVFVFFISIVLARFLSPKEFGLIGMTSIFIAISQSVIDCGFSQALIRKQQCEQRDYSTVFYFNLIISILFYVLLWLTSDLIASYFNQAELSQIIKFISLGVVINSSVIVHRAIFTKEVDFKTQTKISLLSTILSGILGILLAYWNFGVWSLVYKSLINFLLTAIFFWIWSKWRPALIFDFNSLKELFGFGSKLLIGGILDTVFKNLYSVVIGKYHTPQELGYYTRADQFQALPSQNITTVVNRVSYPILAKMQEDDAVLKSAYRKMIGVTMFLTFSIMFFLSAVSEPFIHFVIGSKWHNTVEYLQLLCFVGVFYPLHVFNLNILKVKGKTDLLLRLEVVKKSLGLIVIIVGAFYGIKQLIYALIIFNIVGYFLNSYWSGKLINYKIKSQIYDILPSFAITVLISLGLYFIGTSLLLSNLFKLIILSSIWLISLIGLSELLKLKDYLLIKEVLLIKILKRSQ